MELIKKPSLFSDSRFPMFVRGSTEFDSLRRFVQSYFESLEESGKANNEITFAQEYADVDTTTEEFLDRFYSTLCPGLPTKIKADKRLLLKHARELYQKKGTPDSFHLLFKIIFNETVSLKYPQEFILRASDGTWNQPVAIHAVFGNFTEKEILGLVNQEIESIKKTGVVRNVVLSIKRIDKSNTYEIKIDKQKNISFEIGDPLTIGSVTGAVVPSVISIRILKGGKKFRIGQPLKLDLGPAKGTIVKVINTDNDGGIKKAKIIRYGAGYETDLTLTLSPVSYQSNDINIIEDAELPIMDSTDGFSEYGFISKSGNLGIQYDYFLEDYMMPTEYYTSAIVAYFGGNTYGNTLDGATIDDYAVISLQVGPVITYPGYWSDNKGKLSDPMICLQDNAFYQNFSYVIQSAVPRDQYENHVKQNLHPAGMRMFSDLLIDNVLSVGTDISSQEGTEINVYINDLVDIPDTEYYQFDKFDVDTVDTVDASNYILEKGLSDSVTPSESTSKFILMKKDDLIDMDEYTVNNYYRDFADHVGVIDLDSEYYNNGWVDYNFIEEAGSVIFTKEVFLKKTDTVNSSDVQPTYNAVIGVLDAVTPQESNVKNITTIKTDNIIPNESNTLSLSIIETDTVSIVDNNMLSTTKPVSETISITDTNTFSYSAVETDTVSIVDTTNTTTYKTFSDSITTPETTSFGVIKITPTDTVTTSEIINHETSLDMVDTITVIDTPIYKDIDRLTPTDMITMTDTKVMSSTIQPTDIISVVDAGVLNSIQTTLNDVIIGITDNKTTSILMTKTDTTTTVDSSSSSSNVTINDSLTTLEGNTSSGAINFSDATTLHDLSLYAEDKYMNTDIANIPDVSITVN